jgi:hypothetical protein
MIKAGLATWLLGHIVLLPTQCRLGPQRYRRPDRFGHKPFARMSNDSSISPRKPKKPGSRKATGR